MQQRIREVMKGEKSFKFGGSEGGPVESDETFIGPTPQKMQKECQPLALEPKEFRSILGGG
jgi:hypothetical protein